MKPSTMYMGVITSALLALISLVSLPTTEAGNYTVFTKSRCRDFWDCKQCLRIKNQGKCNAGYFSGVCYKTCSGCGPYVDKADNCVSIAKQGKCFVRPSASPFVTPATKCEKSCCTGVFPQPTPSRPYWDEWTFWGACSKTCNSGIRKRKRTCHSADDGTYCKGYSIESQACNAHIPCYKVDGGWSTWSKWSSCQSTCGYGKQLRSRTCSNPYPQNNGKQCKGSSEMVKWCYAGCCPEAGSWNAWSSWGSCSQTACSSIIIGSGTRERKRICNSPAPYCGGPPCRGDRKQTQKCSAPCPTASVLPVWTAWSSWGPCSKTCSYGYRKRTRTCNHGGHSNAYCPGNTKEYEWCNKDVPCISYP